MKRVHTLLVLTIIYFGIGTASGQSDKLKVEEKSSQTHKLKGYTQSVVALKSGDIISLTRNMGNTNIAYLNLYNENLKKVKTKRLPVEFKDRRPVYHSLQKIGNKYLLFFTFYNETQKKNYLFFVQIDPSDLTWHEDPMKVAEIKYYPITERKYINGYFNIELSDNQKFLIITGTGPALEKGAIYSLWGVKRKSGKVGERSISFWVVNDKLKVVNHREEIEFKADKGSEIEIRDWRSDDSGSVYVLSKIFKQRGLKNSEKKKKGTSHSLLIEQSSFQLNSYSVNGDDYSFATGEDVIYADLNFGISDKNNRIDLAGIRIETIKDITLATEVVSYNLDKSDLSLVQSVPRPFSEKMILEINNQILKATAKKANNALLNKKRKAAKEASEAFTQGIKNLTIMAEIIYNKEGEPTAIMERYWLEIVTKTSTNSQGVTTTTTYYVHHYGDLVLMNLPEEEEEEPVMNFIEKDDYSLSFTNQGFQFFNKNNNWYLFTQRSIRKIDSKSLESKVYNIQAANLKYNSSLSNSPFEDSFILNESEFLGIKRKGLKKYVLVRITPKS